MNENLKTIRTTADDLKTSTTWVYTLIEKGRIDGEMIDAVSFVVWNEKYFDYKKNRKK